MRDSGRGISAERLPNLFDFFSEVHRPETYGGGLGVGLGLTRRLVELHGGRIAVHSEGVGRGAQFVVTLPACADAPASRESAGHPGQPDAGAQVGAGSVTQAQHNGAVCLPAPARRRRVLVVDDNVDSAMSLMMLLQTMGHEVGGAHDGVEALEAAERFAPDTVLLDIGLPRLNGYEVARRLRGQAAHSYLLIALTGWGQDEDRTRARAAGFDYHLVKPVDLDQLGRILDAAVNVDPAARSSTPA